MHPADREGRHPAGLDPLAGPGPTIKSAVGAVVPAQPPIDREKASAMPRANQQAGASSPALPRPNILLPPPPVTAGLPPAAARLPKGAPREREGELEGERRACAPSRAAPPVSLERSPRRRPAPCRHIPAGPAPTTTHSNVNPIIFSLIMGLIMF